MLNSIKIWGTSLLVFLFPRNWLFGVLYLPAMTHSVFSSFFSRIHIRKKTFVQMRSGQWEQSWNCRGGQWDLSLSMPIVVAALFLFLFLCYWRKRKKKKSVFVCFKSSIWLAALAFGECGSLRSDQCLNFVDKPRSCTLHLVFIFSSSWHRKKWKLFWGFVRYQKVAAAAAAAMAAAAAISYSHFLLKRGASLFLSFLLFDPTAAFYANLNRGKKNLFFLLVRELYSPRFLSGLFFNAPFFFVFFLPL